jgi:uncharacterized protein
MIIGRPRRTLSYDSILIHEYYDPYAEPSPRYLILGLPDAGLVGSLASKHLVVSKGLEIVGEIDSPVYFPPVSVVHKQTPMSPIQLYSSKDRKYLLLLSESPIPANAIYTLSSAIIEYSREIGIDVIISMSGIAVPNRLNIQKPKAYWIASSEHASKLVEGKNIERLEEGFIVGPYAVILKEARRRGLNNLVLFVESFYDIPDPESAAVALTILSEILGEEIDTRKLLEEAELLKLQTRELMKQTRRTMSEMQKKYEMQMPLMYQ